MRSRYLVAPVYDWLWFLLPPTLCLALGIAISGTAFTQRTFAVGGDEVSLASLALAIIIHAHLVAVVVRSHGNPTVRRRHPWRFLVVPVVLWVAIVASPRVAAATTIVATIWDVYHSGAQTFGFGRIYDRNEGSAPEPGRRLDFWLNQLLYAGPILAGVTLLDHLDQMDWETFGTVVPAYVEGHQRTVTWAVIAAGTVFLLVYAAVNLRLRRRGYRVSPLKVFLYVSTGACSIYTWGFNSWKVAFFVMNLFHAVQYLALVWASERQQLTRRLRLVCRGNGAATCALYLAGVLVYGAMAAVIQPSFTTLWALTMVVSLMHFWYDGFVWSVRKQHI